MQKGCILCKSKYGKSLGNNSGKKAHLVDTKVTIDTSYCNVSNKSIELHLHPNLTSWCGENWKTNHTYYSKHGKRNVNGDIAVA